MNKYYKNSVSPRNVSWEIFSQIKQGKDMPSAIDQSFRNMPIGKESDEVIPIDEACKDLKLGQYVTYIRYVFQVVEFSEKKNNFCMLKNIKQDALLAKKLKKIPRELTSQQFISIPIKK